MIAATEAAEFALSLSLSYKEKLPMLTKQLRARCSWKPAPQGYLKLNVDGALFIYRNLAGIGMILRDEMGKILLSSSMAVRDVEDPEIIELLAIFRGIQLVA